MSPPTARILPTVYQDRFAISLYDVQYSQGRQVPIPEAVIDDTLASLLRFSITCQDFGVAGSNVRVVATEATRNAINSVDFLRRIHEKLTWKPELLSKEEEGRLGAMVRKFGAKDPLLRKFARHIWQSDVSSCHVCFRDCHIIFFSHTFKAMLIPYCTSGGR